VAKGAFVDDVVAYRTLPADPADCGLLVGAATSLPVDIATFTSASTVRNFVALLGERSPCEVLAGAIIACIGPITAQAAEETGLHVDILAPEHTLEGLLRAIITFLEEQRL
jgi:uroporphyrinogen III methyltransferase/synthase